MLGGGAVGCSALVGIRGLRLFGGFFVSLWLWSVLVVMEFIVTEG